MCSSDLPPLPPIPIKNTAPSPPHPRPIPCRCVLLPLFFAISYSASLVSILSTPIKAQFEVQNDRLGLLFAVYNMPNIVLPLLSGALAARFGAPPVVMCCMTIALIGVLVQALAVGASVFSFAWLLVGRLVFGARARTAHCSHHSTEPVYQLALVQTCLNSFCLAFYPMHPLH